VCFGLANRLRAKNRLRLAAASAFQGIMQARTLSADSELSAPAEEISVT
jgi:hypothetical protein